jgi:hypothetical protein
VTGKNGRILFDRPKPTLGCSASGRRKSNVSYKCYSGHADEVLDAFLVATINKFKLLKFSVTHLVV